MSVYWPLNVLCMLVFLVSSQGTSKKTGFASDHSKLEYKCGGRDHPISQRRTTTEKTVGVGVGEGREVGRDSRRVGQNLKKGGVGNIQGFPNCSKWCEGSEILLAGGAFFTVW